MTRLLDLRVALALVILFAASAAPAAVDDLMQVVPAGAPVVVYVADVQQTTQRWEESPLAELWNDPQVKAFFAPLREEMEIDRWDELVREETGYGMDELKAMLTGDLVVYLASADISFEEEGDEEVELVFLATVGDNASKLEELILQQEERTDEEGENNEDQPDKSTKRETREFRGVDIHVEEVYTDDELVEESGWATVDGILAAASPVETLERAVADILDGGTDEAISSSANFRTVVEHTRDADAWFFLDIEPWVPMVRAGMEAGLTAAQESGSPFPMDANTLAEALALDAMQAVFATVSFPDRTLVSDFGLTYTENRGLMKLIAYGPEEAPRPDYIPADVDTFSSGFFEFDEAWSALVEIVNGINPSLMGLAAMQLQSAVQGAGAELDLRRDLLENLTGELVSIQNLEGISGDSIANLELQQDQVVVLGIQQHEAIENVMETIKTVVGQGSELFRPRDFEGHTIFTLDMPQAEGEPDGQEIAYTITDGQFMISVGSSATLEQVLLQMGNTNDSVWKRRDVRKALGRLPDGAAAVQYQDLASTGHLLFNAIAALAAMESGGDDDPPFCDPSAVPDAGVVGRYLSSAVSGAWKDDRELLIRALVLPAEGK
jgi:hypothetical protein